MTFVLYPEPAGVESILQRVSHFSLYSHVSFLGFNRAMLRRFTKHPPAVDNKFPRPDRIMDETTEAISTPPTSAVASLHGYALRHVAGDPLFMAAAGVWLAVLGPTESISEPAVPAYLQWCSWLVILIAFFGVFWRRGPDIRHAGVAYQTHYRFWRTLELAFSHSPGCRRVIAPCLLRRVTSGDTSGHTVLLARFPVWDSLGLLPKKGG